MNLIISAHTHTHTHTLHRRLGTETILWNSRQSDIYSTVACIQWLFWPTCPAHTHTHTHTHTLTPGTARANSVCTRWSGSERAHELRCTWRDRFLGDVHAHKAFGKK